MFTRAQELEFLSADANSTEEAQLSASELRVVKSLLWESISSSLNPSEREEVGMSYGSSRASFGNACKHACTHTHTYTHTHTHTHTHKCTHARAHAHTRTHTRMHPRTHARTHTHTHTHTRYMFVSTHTHQVAQARLQKRGRCLVNADKSTLVDTSGHL